MGQHYTPTRKKNIKEKIMTVYSDSYIHISKSVGDIDIDPWEKANVQPNSYELTLEKHLYLMSLDKDGKMEAIP